MRPRYFRTAISLACAAALLAGGCTAAKSASPPAAPTAADTVTTPPLDAHALERAVHRAANRARQRHGHPPLAWRDSLALLARRHSRDMAARSFFAHVTPEGTGPVGRAVRLGLPSARALPDENVRIGVGENLFRTYRHAGYRDVYRQRGGQERQRVRRIYDWKNAERLAEQAVQGWLDSPPHRRILLSADYRQHGLGVALSGEDDRVYVTQNLF